MRMAALLVCAVTLALTAACSSASTSESGSSSASEASSEGATRVVNLAPLLPAQPGDAQEERDRQPAPGWSYGAEPDLVNGVECDAPSPGAVSGGIMSCTPTSPACWPASQGMVTCLQDIWKKTLKQVMNLGSGASVSAPKDPEPLGITLDDGTNCNLRTGGSFNSRVGPPELFVNYTCSSGYLTWVPQGGGIDKSSPAWTVQTGGEGNDPLVTRKVTEAYFVTN